MPRRFVLTASSCAIAAAVVLTACSSNDRGAERTPTQSSANSSTSSSSATSSTSSTLARGDLNAANVKLTKIASPTSATALAVRAGDPALYVTEQVGKVRAVRNGKLDPTNVVDLQSVVGSGGERGLLGLTFSKDGTKLYVNFTDKSGNTHIAELTMQADGTADPASRKDLLTITQPEANHNGGDVILGPDGMLYVGMGDGGAAGDQGPGHVAGGNGQSTGTLLGKLLRIDPTPSADKPYSIPADNPFVAGGGRPEIWAYGLRNPWRFSFDKATGDLWIGDVGQNAWEEIDFARAKTGAGANYGWNVFEGSHRYRDGDAPGAVNPIFEYPHDSRCAVSGGYVYRGSKIPALMGGYLYSDSCDGVIRAINEVDGKTNQSRDLGVRGGQRGRVR